MVTDTRERAWEVLFDRAVELLRVARDRGLPVDDWTFGGGTVLMHRHRHRLSRDIDIFINDPQFIGYLSPRLNARAEEMTRGHYVEESQYVKLFFEEGEIDFVAAGPLTRVPAARQTIRGYPILVETSTEIVAKKVFHRGPEFTARDIFDLAMVSEREPGALEEIPGILRDASKAIRARIQKASVHLSEEFRALTPLEYRRTFDECVAIVERTLSDGP